MSTTHLHHNHSQLISTTNPSLNLTSSSGSASSPSLTSLLHQKLTTNNNNQLRNQSYYHQSISDKNRGQICLIRNNQHQNLQNNNNEKKIILNDIAAGLCVAVAAAVSDAVSSVQQQINHSQERGIAQNNITPSLANTSSAPPQQSPRDTSTPQQPQQQFSQLRQQLESKSPPQPIQNQTILRKRLSNLNIEAAVTHAVNNYLNTTIKNTHKFSGARQQLSQDENVILVDDFAKRGINSV